MTRFRFFFPVLVLTAAFAQRPQTPESQQRPQPTPAPRAEASAPTPPGAPGTAPSQFPAPPAVERLVKTQHSITVRGQKVPYTATTGTLLLKREDDRPRASIFFIAYTRDDASDKGKRPLTFSFNGGPGSSSVWLHLGAFGPRRVNIGNLEGEQPPPPYQLIENDASALAFTDLVFIDPVTTGFSRHAPGENPQQFHGIDGDLESVADFIRLYTTRFERWSSPKYLAGESYGTTRAAGLSQVLLQRHGIYLNGITLVSSIMNFGTARFEAGNDLPYILFLPTYTATAWYHKKLPADLQGDFQKALNEARRFALNEYSTALMKGDKLAAKERTDTARQIARLSGLSQRYVELSNLRVPIFRFTKELLREQRQTVGRYDSRIKGIDLDAAGERPEYDPSYNVVQGAYTAMFNDYVRTQLKYETDLPYEILTGRVQPWNYGRFQNTYVNVAENLRQAMTQNPSLKVLVVNGYYDLATPFFATEYTVSHLGLDASMSNHVTMSYCEAGHMMYTKKSCLDGMYQAMAAFYRAQ